MHRSHQKNYILSYILFSILFSLPLIFMIFILNSKKPSPSIDTDQNISPQKSLTVIIDAGHGGEDGGAIGKNGVYEKDINLDVAKDLSSMLRSCGINVVMTRETDTMLYEKNVDYKGRKKLLDLAARLKIGESYDNCIFVSIHMNSFPQEKYRGLQVYYSPNRPESALLANAIQDSVHTSLQPQNQRKTKSATKSIFLMDRISKPAVLIECGFISNAEECDLLCSHDYRQKLTFAIFCGITEFISENTT